MLPAHNTNDNNNSSDDEHDDDNNKNYRKTCLSLGGVTANYNQLQSLCTLDS